MKRKLSLSCLKTQSNKIICIKIPKCLIKAIINENIKIDE